VIATVVVLTRSGDGRTAYVHRNEAVLAPFPVFPGAVKIRETSSPHDPNCTPGGFGTSVDYRVPPGTRAADVVKFYAGRLERRGWHGKIYSSPVLGRVVSHGVPRLGKVGKSLSVAFRRARREWCSAPTT
jgi:hypothetical protein